MLEQHGFCLPSDTHSELEYARNMVNVSIRSLLWRLLPSRTTLLQFYTQRSLQNVAHRAAFTINGSSLFNPTFFFYPLHPLKIGIMSLLSEAHPLQFLCTARQPITSSRLRGHLAAVDRREQLSTGPCRGGVSQTLHPKHLWRLIHCSSGLRSPRTACNCHRDQYALG